MWSWGCLQSEDTPIRLPYWIEAPCIHVLHFGVHASCTSSDGDPIISAPARSYPSCYLSYVKKTNTHQQQWEEAMGERWTWSWIFLLVPIECGPSFQAILVRNVTIQMLPSLAALIEVNAVGQPLHNIQFVRGSALGDPRIVSQTLQTLRGHWTANRIQIDCNCVKLRNQDGPIKSMIQ